jgi:pentatricopeptide repeat protein
MFAGKRCRGFYRTADRYLFQQRLYQATSQLSYNYHGGNFKRKHHKNMASSVVSSSRQTPLIHNGDTRYRYHSSKSPLSPSPPLDYQSMAMDRIVLKHHSDQQIDAGHAEAEANLQRLADECLHDPNGPNLLLNMLEMMHAEDIPISNATMMQVFTQILRSKNSNLLKKAQALVLTRRQDDTHNFAKRLVVGYVQANDPKPAFDMLLSNQSKNRNAPLPLQSYRLVLDALSKQGDHERAFRLLQHLCDACSESSKEMAEQQSASAVADAAGLPIPDRECFHAVLSACIHSTSDERLSTAQKVLQCMMGIQLRPNRTTFRLFLKIWSMTNDAKERQLLQDEAFDWLQKMEHLAQAEKASHVQQSQDSPDIQSYNIILNAVAEDGNYTRAEECYQKLLTAYLDGTSNARPDHVSLHTVLKAHQRARSKEAAEAAEEFLVQLEEWSQQQQKSSQRQHSGARTVDIRPPSRCYATVLGLYVDLGMPDQAIRVLDRAEALYSYYLSEGRGNRQRTKKFFRPDIICYRNIVNALYTTEPCTSKVALQAQDMVRRMVKVGHKADLLTCNTVLACWIKTGRPSEAEVFLKQIMVQGLQVKPDVISYNTLIQGFCAQNDLDRAIDILENMLDSAESQSPNESPSPNARTFSSILMLLAKQKSLQATKKAEALVQQMQILHDTRQLDTRPNSFTYNALMSCWANLSYHDPKNSHEYGQNAERILMEMRSLSKKDERPTVVSYNTVFKAYRNDIVKTEQLLDDMCSHGLKPNKITWETVRGVLKHAKGLKNKREKLEELQQKYFLNLPN